MRADRLLRALFVLQSREMVTAAELAAELEVSLATARRDLEALASAGVPVYPQRGRAGGWSLLGGARTDLSGLTEPETTALFSLLGQTRGAPAEAADAIRKLLRALPATFREGAERAIGSVVREDAPWGERDATPPELLPTLQLAIAQQRVVSIAYGDADPVDVAPLGVAAKGPRWYLLAHRRGMGRHEQPRLYRLDRMRSATVIDETVARDPAFNLDEAWRQASERIEALRGSASATVRVEPHAVEALLSRFGAQATDLGPAPDGRTVVDARAHTVQALAEQLAGWAEVAEVTGPTEVRAELARLGGVLVERYR
ncbi:helix-turn-helix transcriptional regulator [Microbacterium stercoris]|uniref:WYL domain-containing protein n=1 Tax=Microbacterium stercoris TaxID=2820289 RepID=A0A939QLP0_9MICO|nr:WYL domain-containing protein [Microbacterium stercoris]MBO3663040.1 WYL domain-containing protein [Microbacterium stercoris]